MALSSKTFRIFVSSTFSDLKEERNALQERVFPRLRDLCMAHGFRFQAIDLRWGVSEEAALDQQTVRICLEEIARCQRTALKPNFIVLLGDRYGWCPLPYEIPASEYEEIERRIDDPSSHKLLADWYRRDDNAVPPVYVLQRRAGEYANPGAWEERVERPLRTALPEAVAGMDLPQDARLKYAASATEQEIVRGAMYVEDAGDHVFCFFRSFLAGQADGSVAVRREDGSLSPIDEVLREGEFHHFVDRAPHGEFDPGAYARLANLKGRLESLLPGKTMKYEARWTDSGVTLSHLDALCTDVYNSLSREILKQISRFEKTDPQEQENQAHEEYGEERARFFVGRDAILNMIREHINSGNRHPLAIWGAPGSGKSALIARAVQETRQAHPDAEIIARFIGATPPSSDGRTLLEDLCWRIGRTYGSEEETPLEYRDLVREFPKRLALATKGKPLVLFLDALDQLSAADRTRSLTWLPAELPENVGLVVSSIPGECTDALERKLPSDRRVELGPMPTGEGTELLDRWLSFAKRTLRHSQKSEVLGKFAKCGMPIYLKLAFEEARRWKSYDDLPSRTDGKPGLSEDVPSLIENFFRRLSREEEHGETLVSRSLGYIAAGKNGLAEDELLDVLSGDSEVIQDFQKRSPKSPKVSSMPIVVWSRLRADLEPYLTERRADGTSLISFYHRQFEETVARNYLQRDSRRLRHESLALYFASSPLWSETDGKKIPNNRKVSELPFQQAHGRLATALKDTLTDFYFMYAKVIAVGPQPLVADYDLASIGGLMKTAGISETAGHALELIQGALHLSAHLLKRDPNLLAGQLMGRLMSFKIPEIKVMFSQIRNWRKVPWLRPVVPSLHPPDGPLVRTLKGHIDYVKSIAVTIDGRWVISGSNDGAIKVWDFNSGEELRTFLGHTSPIISVTVTPDGNQVISAYKDNTLKVWNLVTGEELRTIKDHTPGVELVNIMPSARRAILETKDSIRDVWNYENGKPETVVHSIRVWNLETGEVQAFFGEMDDSRIVAVSWDVRRAVSGCMDGTLKVWNLETGRKLRILKGHKSKINTAVIPPDGRRVVSGSADGSIKVWDLENGNREYTLKGRVFEINHLAVTPDGEKIISISKDGSINIWNFESGKKVRTLGDYTRYGPLTLFPDGRRAVSGGNAGPLNPLKILDLETGKTLMILEGLSGHVTAVVVTPDGRHVIAGVQDGTLKVWDVEHDGKLYFHKDIFHWVHKVVATPHRRRAVSCFVVGPIQIWNMESGKVMHTLRFNKFPGYSFTDVAVTPDGERVVSIIGKWIVNVWDIECGKLLRTLLGEGPSNLEFRKIVLTPDGRCLVSCSKDGIIKVWDLGTGEVVRSFGGHSRELVWLVLATSDGRRVLTGSSDKTLKIWDLDSGKLLRTLKGHKDWIEDVAVTPDGHRVLTGSSDKTLKVWDLNSGKLLRTLEGHNNSVWAILVTPDGRRAVSGSRDGTMKVWDLESWEMLRTVDGHSRRLEQSVSVTPDGHLVVSRSQDGSAIKVWNLESGEEIAGFGGDSEFTAVHLGSAGITIMAGEWSGRVHFLRLENFTPGPPVETVFSSTSDRSMAFCCQLCRGWSSIPKSMLGTELLCPKCGKNVRLNPFTIKADWRPIEKAWRGKSH